MKPDREDLMVIQARIIEALLVRADLWRGVADLQNTAMLNAERQTVSHTTVHLWVEALAVYEQTRMDSILSDE